jgi:uncharacterized coiled-coil protein SlyX
MNRFTPTFFNNNFFMDEDEDGDYVLYTDHLAALAEEDTIIALKDGTIDYKQEQIAALTARCESLDRVVGECGQRELELEARIKELEAVVASLQMLTEPKQR